MLQEQATVVSAESKIVGNGLAAFQKKPTCYEAVARLLAGRQRTRNRLGLQNLILAMIKAGHRYKRQEYADVLALFCEQGHGVLEYTKRGKIKGLKSIKVPIQSLVKQPSMLKRLVQSENVSYKEQDPKAFKVREYTASLAITVDGEDIKFELPKKMSMKKFQLLMLQLQKI